MTEDKLIPVYQKPVRRHKGRFTSGLIVLYKKSPLLRDVATIIQLSEPSREALEESLEEEYERLEKQIKGYPPKEIKGAYPVYGFLSGGK